MKKSFNELRSQMGKARIVCSDERAQKMLDELLIEGLESGEPVPMNNVYWTDLRERIADSAGENTSAYGSLKNEISLGTKAQERQVVRDARIKKYTNPQ